VPVPVQPIKAAAAIAIARELPPETIGAAAMTLGAVLVVLGATGATRFITRVFSTPIVRGLQLGVGLILTKTAFTLAGGASNTGGLVAAGAIAIVLTVGSRWRETVPLAVLVVIAAAVFGLVTGHGTSSLGFELWTPRLNTGAFDPSVLMSAVVLLVIPQIPLTLGNAVVAVVDLEHRYFPLGSRKVNPAAVSVSSGLANMTVGALTGMPMCHGSGGLTAHYRAGAETYRMNLVIGLFLLTCGLVAGPSALAILQVIPAPVLAGFLSFTGLFHASLAAELRGFDLAVAVCIGLIGLLTTNLAMALAAGLLLYWPRRYVADRHSPAKANT
jgi:sulfate permease, SulP family